MQNILGQKRFSEPDEMGVIKEYIKRRYNSGCRVKIENDTVVLGLPSSALAATVQLEKNSLIKGCGLKKRLIIRVGR